MLSRERRKEPGSLSKGELKMSLIRDFRLYSKWWKTWRTLPVFAWLKAASYYRNGKFDAAISLYKRGLEKQPEHPAHICARLDLAYCLFRVGRLREAEEHLLLAAAQAPDSREAQLRLVHFQTWTGRSLEAAWTVRRALRRMKADTELVAAFIHAVLDNDGPAYLLKEATEALSKLTVSSGGDPKSLHKLEVARARLLLIRGQVQKGEAELARLAGQSQTSVQAVLSYAQLLIRQRKVAFARQQLRRGLILAPNHPQILSTLAESYLVSGPFYNPDYAVQLATNACQQVEWLSPRTLHVLAEAYYHLGDRMSALLMASKAKQAGSRLMGAYREAQSLERLIESLSSGTLA